MNSSLSDLRTKIFDAIRGIEGLKPDDVFNFVRYARNSCVSFESAQDFIDDYGLEIISNEKMRKEESAKLDSASLRPDTLAQEMISTASRENKMTICAHAETDLAKASMENTMANANRKQQVTLLADAHTTELTGSGLSTDLMGPGPLTEETGPGPPTKLTGSGFPTPYRRAIFTCRQCFQIICRRHRHGVIVRVLIHHGCRPPPAPNLESILRHIRGGSNFYDGG